MKKVLSLALCLLLCLGLCATAFAEGEGEAPADVLATTGLVKQLSIVDEITDPELTFNFVFSAVTASEAGYFTPTSGPAPSLSTAAVGGTNAMTDSVDLQSGAITFKSLFGTSELLAGYGITHAGVWQYTVKETPVASPAAKVTETEKEKITVTPTLTCDSAEYRVTLVVKNGEDGKPAVDSIIVEKKTTETTYTKVDATITETTVTETIPGSEGTSGTSESKQFSSGFEFDNKYTESKKVEPIGPINPEIAALSAKKLVVAASDDAEDYGDHTLAFDFSMTLTAPSNMIADLNGTTYTAEITRDETQPTSVTENSIDFTFGADGKATATFKLSDKDVLGFKELPVGVSYTVTETVPEGYTQKSTSATDGTLKDSDGSTNAVISNSFNFTPPVGVVINNLPFILLVVLAVGGIAVYFVSSRRRSDEA